MKRTWSWMSWAVAAALVMGLAPAALAQEITPTSLDASEAQDLIGTWNIDMEFQGNPVTLKLTVEEIDGKVGALLDMIRNKSVIKEIEKTDSGYALKYPVDFGGQEMQLTMDVTIDGESLTGTISDEGGFFTADVSGSPAGTGDDEAPVFLVRDATDLPTEAAREYVGHWDLKMDFRGNDVDLTLDILDVNDRLGAVVLARFSPDPQIIEEMEVTPEGLKMSYEASFGPQSFVLNIIANVNGDNMEGTLADTGGFFEATFEGTRSGESNIEIARAGEGDRRRRSSFRRQQPGQARLELMDSEVEINHATLKVGSEDFETFQNLKEGEVFNFVDGRATKIMTEGHLKFGDTTVQAGNAHPTYPGVYSMWLKKTAGGWSLVFNEHADIWGTQHLDEADVVEIPLTVTESEEEKDTFTITLEESDEDTGKLNISWGKHAWTADFDVVPFEPETSES